MSDEKSFPIHGITFSEKQIDANGQEKLGKPIEVATIWPRKNGKQGGILDWHVDPGNLPDGVYFQLDKERERTQQQTRDGFNDVDQHAPSRDQGRGR